jgi:hypothetical protein
VVKFDPFVLVVIVDVIPVIEKLLELAFYSLLLLQKLNVLALASLHCGYLRFEFRLQLEDRQPIGM